jgi:nucleotide-binding universal stress UspA family protein
VPLQRIRPAVEVLEKEIGVEHALASKRLYTDGAEVLFDYANKSGEREVRETVHPPRSLVIDILRHDEVTDLAGKVHRVAGRIDASLIVMGSVGRAGVPGFFIGNTAEKVLRSCDRSILTVKPDGFVSPVEA